MKEKIKYEYHIDADNIIEKEQYCMFQKEETFFYLTKIRRNEEEVNDLLALYEELKVKNYPVHTIIKTISGSITTKINNEYYMLICIEKPMEEYTLFDMLKIWDQMPLTSKKSSLIRPNWALLWSEKIDYFEYQIRELGKNKEVVLNSFSYFIGLSENAIAYINHVNKTIKPMNVRLSLCHRRVYFPNYHLNYDNPLGFVIDLEVRDIAEYLKGMALEDPKLALIDLKSYIEIRKPNIYSLSMLYGRLLYPSYYFDLYENVMNFDVEEECLIKIVDKVPNIEQFLKQSYELLSHYGSLEPVEWLLKKEVTTPH